MSYLKGYKFRAFMGVFFKFVEAVFELLLPLIMVYLIDVALLAPDFTLVYKLVFLMFLMSVLGYLASVTCQYNASVVSQGVGGQVRSALMKKINSFSSSEMNKIGASTLVNRMIVDVKQLELMVAMTIRLAVRAPLLMIGSLFAMRRINAQIARTLLMFFPLFIVVILIFMGLSLFLYRRMQDQLDTLMNKVLEFLSGIRIVRAFSRVDDELVTMHHLNTDLSKKTKHMGIASTLSSPITMLLMNIVMLVLIYQGAGFINTGSMTQGQMVAIINYCTQLVLALVVFMNLVLIYARGISATLRLKEVLTMTPEIQNKEDAITKLDKDITIHFENVSFSYPDEKRKIIDNMSFIIKPNSYVGFIGLTGSGKTTIMHLLMRYYDVDEGAIYLNDVNIKDIDLKTLRNTIGFATQTSGFFKDTLKENVKMGRDVDVTRALTIAQGNEILDKGLKSMIEAGGKNLSGGQKQRVNIARALASNPSVLILDDSLSALDYLTDKQLRQSLEDNFAHMSRLVITQRTSSLVDADTIYVINKGRLEDAGTHEKLLTSNKLYRDIHQTQIRGDEHA
ncbi:MAG TPA: ABC transporter ATP-binding protein [Erysipelothrix sp.]|nr:ABC transporter ATP-binding protein [Erysipelothrix sp.]